MEVVSASRVNLTFGLIAVAKDAPHPNAARLLADFLTSTEGQILYCNAATNTAVDPEAAKKTRANLEFARRGIELAEIPLEFATEANFQKSTDFWMTLLARRG